MTRFSASAGVSAPDVVETPPPTATNKLRLVCATRLSTKEFFAASPLGRSLSYYQTYPRGQAIDLRLFPEHSDGFPAAYNVAIEESRTAPAILVFIRDDTYLSDFYWAQRLIAALGEFRIIGLAGNIRRGPSQASWLYLDDRLTRDSPANLSGAIGYGTGFPNLSEFTAFGEAPREVKLLDGTLLAVRSATLIDTDLRFDPRFPIHFHDVDFCRQAEALHVRMGTWPISAIRRGMPDADEEWRCAYRDYLAKYGETLPPIAPVPGADRVSPEGIAEDLDHAISAHRQGRVQEAVAAYREVLRQNSLHPVALHFLGVGLGQLKEFAEAAAVLAKAIELCPTDPPIHVHYGNALWGLHRAEEALRLYDQAISLDPLCVDAHCNRGKVLNEVGCPDRALESFDRALALAPRHGDAHNNRGSVLAALGRDAEALNSYDRALELDPSLSGALWNKSLVLLRQGNFRDGWGCHAACPEYQSPNTVRRFPSKPAWDGTQSLDGKTLLLHADQGYGDVIQYCRFAPLLQARGAKVILEVPGDLRSLIQSLGGIDTFTTQGDDAPTFDLQCPFSNLPAALRTDLATIPRSVPYLRVDEATKRRWAKRLGRPVVLRAGLVWSGNSSHRQDGSRSIPLAALGRLKDTGVEFVSLQKEVRGSDASSVASLCGRHFGAELSDFSDTAAVISQLDVVISVDTAVAHLAGALGALVWVLLPLVPDWRWMVARNDSPWYPTARLFRQAVRGQWDAVIEAVHHELLGLVSARRSRNSHRS